MSEADSQSIVQDSICIHGTRSSVMFGDLSAHEMPLILYNF